MRSSKVIATEQLTADIVFCKSFTLDNPIAPAAKISPNDNSNTIPGQIN
jgi:hypothetical protein